MPLQHVFGNAYPIILALTHVELRLTLFQRTLNFDEIFRLGSLETSLVKVLHIDHILGEITVFVVEDNISLFTFLFTFGEFISTRWVHADVVADTAGPVALIEVKSSA